MDDDGQQTNMVEIKQKKNNTETDICKWFGIHRVIVYLRNVLPFPSHPKIE